jgi:hypothetical protein
MIAMYNLIVFLLLAFSVIASCQSSDQYAFPTEKIIAKKGALKAGLAPRVEIIGNKGNLISLISIDSLSRPNFFLYDELQYRLFKETVKINSSSKMVGAVRLGDKFIFTGYFDVPDSLRDIALTDMPIENFEYQDFWFMESSGSFKFDRLPMHFIDKYYQIKFSFSGNHLICNAFTSRTTGYDSVLDGFFIVYDLTKAKNKNIRKHIVKCDMCMNTFLFDETFIFQKDIEIGGGFDGFHHNIYISPRNKVNDTTKLANDIELLSLTPDGKYILGAKYLYGKHTAVILNVESRRFQYIMGRDYLNYPFFYSELEKKFAFDFGNHIIYVDFPRTFPFDSLRLYKTFTKREDNETFWRRYQLPSLQEN